MTLDTQALVGTWRRFGSAGPVYEVIGAPTLKHGAIETVRIRVLETGEEIDYGVSDLLDDPRER